MDNDIFSINRTEIGSNHIRMNKICEDASASYDDNNLHIIAVADGHGSDNYPRTERGSKFAVEAALSCVKEFVKYAQPNELLNDKKYYLLNQLSKSILLTWHNLVEKDFEANPFTEEEMRNVSEKYKKRYLKDDFLEGYFKKAYGTTLIMFAITREYSFGIHIGDGKYVVIGDDGTFEEPIPWDDDCEMNVTTSICDDDAINKFRYYVTDKKMSAVFCSSDGIEDSYPTVSEIYALYRSILKIFLEHGKDTLINEIREYLPTLTKHGSGDDVSIALIINPKLAQKIENVLQKQTDVFNLNQEINQKELRYLSGLNASEQLRKHISKMILNSKRHEIEKEQNKLWKIENENDSLEQEISKLRKELEELKNKENQELNSKRILGNQVDIPSPNIEEDVSVDEKIEETKELYLKEHVTHESIDIRLNDEKNVIQNDVCDKTNISEEDDGLNIPFSNERDSL